MTSKLKCLWCGSEMMYSVLGQNLMSSHFCDNKDCKAFQMVLPDNLWKDIFLWKQSQKDLEIATKALEKYADEDMWGNCCIWDVDYIQGMFLEHGYKIAKEALEQIEVKEI